jgi:hypothetical protein
MTTLEIQWRWQQAQLDAVDGEIAACEREYTRLLQVKRTILLAAQRIEFTAEERAVRRARQRANEKEEK